jgi:hypothetical protein
MDIENFGHEGVHLKGKSATDPIEPPGSTLAAADLAQGRPKQGQPPRRAATRASGGAWGQLFLLAGISPLCRRAWPAHSWERVDALRGVALGRNRDELAANTTPDGLLPMQVVWRANRPISAQPEGQAPGRAVCGVAKPRRATGPAAFCVLQPIPTRRLRDPHGERQHVPTAHSGPSNCRF